MFERVEDYRKLPAGEPYDSTRAIVEGFRAALVRGGMAPDKGELWQGFSGLDYGYGAEVGIPEKKAPAGLRFWAGTRGSWRKFRAKTWYAGLCDNVGVPFVCCRSSGSLRTRTPEMLNKWYDEMADVLFLNAETYVRWAAVLKKRPCGVQDALVRLLEQKRRGREMERLTPQTLLKIHKEYERSAKGKTAWNLLMTFAAKAVGSGNANMKLHALDQCYCFARPFLEGMYDKGVSA